MKTVQYVEASKKLYFVDFCNDSMQNEKGCVICGTFHRKISLIICYNECLKVSILCIINF